VLACALAALIVSGDQDLLVLGAFNHMRILPARQGLEFITANAA
jgi:predicted nucleic acid-binding protein